MTGLIQGPDVGLNAQFKLAYDHRFRLERQATNFAPQSAAEWNRFVATQMTRAFWQDCTFDLLPTLWACGLLVPPPRDPVGKLTADAFRADPRFRQLEVGGGVVVSPDQRVALMPSTLWCADEAAKRMNNEAAAARQAAKQQREAEAAAAASSNPSAAAAASAASASSNSSAAASEASMEASGAPRRQHRKRKAKGSSIDFASSRADADALVLTDHSCRTQARMRPPNANERDPRSEAMILPSEARAKEQRHPQRSQERAHHPRPLPLPLLPPPQPRLPRNLVSCVLRGHRASGSPALSTRGCMTSMRMRTRACRRPRRMSPRATTTTTTMQRPTRQRPISTHPCMITAYTRTGCAAGQGLNFLHSIF